MVPMTSSPPKVTENLGKGLEDFSKTIDPLQKVQVDEEAANEMAKLKEAVDGFVGFRKFFDQKLADKGVEIKTTLNSMTEVLKEMIQKPFPPPQDFQEPAAGYVNYDEEIKEYSKLTTDFLLGVTLGTSYDVFSLGYAVAMDQTLFGDPAGLDTKVLYGAAVILPFITGPMMVHGSQALKNLAEMAKNGKITQEIFLAMKEFHSYLPGSFKKIIENLNTESGHILPETFLDFKKATEPIKDALKELEEVLQPKRILPGTNGKYAVIGRTMGNTSEKGVRDVEKALSKNFSVEIFDDGLIPDRAHLDFAEWKKKFSDGRIPDHEIPNTLMFNANKEWAEKIKNEGYTIIDIGNSHNKTPSVFYEMEIETIFK
jgi:hypothetical protein